MIKVCLKDGHVVYEFNTIPEFVDAFPDGLDQENLNQGCYVNCTIRQAQEIAWEREDRKRRYNTKLPFVGQRCRD